LPLALAEGAEQSKGSSQQITGLSLRTVLEGHNEPVRYLTFSPDGRTMASASVDGTIKLWDLTTAEVRATYGGQICYCLAVSPDGRTLASADQNGSVKLWDLAAGEVQRNEQLSAASPGEQYQMLVKEFDEATRKFSAEYRQAKTDNERQKLFRELYPQPQKYAPRFLKLATEHPDDPFAVDALVWIVSRAQYGRESDKALQILTSDHIESAKLQPVVHSLMYGGSPAAQEFLRSVLEKSPHEDVKGWACYCLAKALMQSQRGQPAKKEDARSEAEKLLERVVDEYGNVKSYRGTLADLASGDLFELRHLSIGCVAPDIAGEDIEGVSFKLSDYRGKVVVLDFWGDW
jgi:hypothetical protein